jgi:WD40 repeat protein
VAWHPEGDRALTGGGDGSLIIWDMASNTALAEQQLHDGAINDIALSPDGTMAATASADGTISLVDAVSAEIILRMEGHEGPVNDVSFSPDGQRLVSGGADMLVLLWDVATGEIVNSIPGHTRSVTGVDFVDQGAAILSGSEDQTFRKWDIVSGEQLQLRQLGDTADEMALSPDGHNVIRVSSWVIYWWNMDQFQGPSQKLAGHEGLMIHDLSFSRDGKIALSAGSDGTVRVWSLGESDVQQTPLGFLATGVAVSPDGAVLALAGLEPDALLWDVAANEPRQTLNYVPSYVYNPGTIAISPDGRYVAGGAGEYFLDTHVNGVAVWDLASGDMLCDFQEHITVPRTVAFDPDNKILSGSMGAEDDHNDLILWDAETCAIIFRLPTNAEFSGVNFSADGKFALSSDGGTEKVTLWDLLRGEAVRSYELPDDFLLDAAFGPQDETVIGSAVSGLIVQWDRETGEEIRRFVGHDGGVWALDISKDGRWLASSDDAGQLILWDLATGSPIRRNHTHTAPAFDLTLSPDDQTIYSVSADETLVAWHIGDPSLEGLLAWIEENRYVRELTCAEREQYNVEPFCR